MFSWFKCSQHAQILKWRSYFSHSRSLLLLQGTVPHRKVSTEQSVLIVRFQSLAWCVYTCHFGRYKDRVQANSISFTSSFYIRSRRSQVYPLMFGSQKIPVYCHMGNFGCGDGGWTLAMKINGAKVNSLPPLRTSRYYWNSQGQIKNVILFF